jgi:hypothetical protein
MWREKLSNDRISNHFQSVKKKFACDYSNCSIKVLTQYSCKYDGSSIFCEDIKRFFRVCGEEYAIEEINQQSDEEAIVNTHDQQMVISTSLAGLNLQ